MNIFTSRITYRGNDRLDITATGRDRIGKHFAPLYTNVSAYRHGGLSWTEYCTRYLRRMETSKELEPEIWNYVLSRRRVVLVCYCKPLTNCHRYLLAGMLESFGAIYCGEI